MTLAILSCGGLGKTLAVAQVEVVHMKANLDFWLTILLIFRPFPVIPKAVLLMKA